MSKCQYLAGVSNVILVEKPNETCKMHLDLTYSNKTWHKDIYPLPKIDKLVNFTAGHELLGFMDAFSGYHHILLAKQDQEKTAFIVNIDLYYYNMIPFGLKNVDPTYQSLVNKVFATLVGKTMEVYVDDMITKSVKINRSCEGLQHPKCTYFTVYSIPKNSHD